MNARRITPQTNQDGQRLTYEQRKAERQRADRSRRIEQRQAKQAAQLDALANPPTAPLPFRERQAIRKAEAIGKAEAADKQRAEAAASAPPINPYRQRAQEIEGQLYRPGMRQRYEHFAKLAEQYDREQAAKAEAAERQAAIDADPQVKTARDYAAGLLKLAPPEFQNEAAEVSGIAQAGDAGLAWQRMRDLEQRIWQHQDRLAADKRASKAATDAEFQEAAAKAEQARERAEHAAKIAGELNPD